MLARVAAVRSSTPRWHTQKNTSPSTSLWATSSWRLSSWASVSVKTVALGDGSVVWGQLQHCSGAGFVAALVRLPRNRCCSCIPPHLPPLPLLSCAVGFVMGMVFGILTRLFLRFMRCSLSHSVSFGSGCASVAQQPARLDQARTADMCVAASLPCTQPHNIFTTELLPTELLVCGGLLRNKHTTPWVATFRWFSSAGLLCRRYMGATHDQEVALTLGMAYLAYWITGIPCKGSGEATCSKALSVWSRLATCRLSRVCWACGCHTHAHTACRVACPLP